MNFYAGLLFLEGHIADPKLARALAGPADRARPATRQPPLRKCCDQPKVSRHGAIVSVCCAGALSPFR